MKKIVIIIIALITLILTTSSIAFADSSGPLGPNPQAGDGWPDGSSLDVPNGPNGYVGSGSGSIELALNSGDNIPDGSGF